MENYLHELQELADTDLQSCDINLLKTLLSFFTKNSLDEYGNIYNKIIIINVYVEDLEDKQGPFKVPCVPNWLGKTCKEKFQEYFDFPICDQTLLVDFVIVDDDQNLFSAGITNSDSVLHVFLHHSDETLNMIKVDQTESFSLECSANQSAAAIIEIQAEIDEKLHI